jgi:hypothetical protein
MKGTLTRVFLAYPMALPLILGALAFFFPGYFSFDDATQRFTFSATVPEMIAAVGASYGFIAGVFAKWGIKK